MAALTVACIGSLFTAVSPAFARPANVFSSYFGAASSTPSNPYPLSEPTDVAVDQETHDVYVTDPGNHRVEKFDSSGNLILMFGESVNQTTGGDICTIASGDTCQAGTAGSFPGDLTTPTFIAVDNSGGPSNGDVYIGDTADGAISKFESSGSLITGWGTNGLLTNFTPLYGIAVDRSGNLFVLSEATFWYEPSGERHSTFEYPRATSPADLAVDGQDRLYKADGTPEVTKFTDTGENLGEPDGTGSAVGLAIDPVTNDLFVDEGGSAVSHFTLDCGQHCEPEDTFGSGHLSNAVGLGVDGSAGTVYVANTGEGNVAVFPAAILPNVTTEAATNPGQTSEKVNGHVDPAGGANVNSCRFEYGTDTTYSLGSVPCSPALPYSSPTNVSANLTGLTPEITYHYRLVAGNESGSTEGKDETLITHWVAGIETEPPTDIAAHSAKLNASWVGNGEDTHYYFEYGPTESYGSTSAIPPGADGGSASGPQSATFNLTGLSVFTTYHYRIVASNPAGTSYGADVSFHTLGGHVFGPAFGSAGSGSGQLSDPQDVAVDESSGDLYVADTGNHRIVKFDRAGGFVSAWGWGVSDGQTASEICTTSCEAGISGSGPGQFTTPTFIAVDNSSGSSAGDVYVADTTTNTVQKFEPSGNLITSWGTDGATKYSEEIGGIAVTSNGKLVVQPGAGSGISVDSFGHVVGGSVAVELSTNNDYYNYGNEVQEFKTSCEPNSPCSPADGFGNGILNSAGGITINSETGVLYVANSGDDELVSFSPLPLPEVTTMPVVTLGPTSATLVGHIDPKNSGNVTECRFEYGTDTTYSLGSVPCSPAPPYSSPTNVSANLTGLTPFTTYHFRLVATGADSQEFEARSRDLNFTPAPGLAPSVDSTSTSELTPTTATLSASINPHLSATIYRFQYGTSASYGSQTSPSESIGSDGTDHAVSDTISGLQPATTYYFRVVAVNFSGVTWGTEGSFTTPALPSIAATLASNIDATTAELSAAVSPGFRPTTYHFDYGRTSAYGSSTAESASIGSDDSSHSVSATISNLAPLALYHFRVVATNAVGSTEGPDQTFTTVSPTTTVPPLLSCKKGFEVKGGRCIKRPRHQKRPHRSRGHKKGNR